jgi:hypothetical protein
MMVEKKQLYCVQRHVWVAATPEEIIRQNLLNRLIQHLNFPAASIVVEKELRQLPHINDSSLPDRRADVLCYAKQAVRMHPLLLIECKAVPICAKEVRQVIGYNHYVKASFIALVNETEHRLGWFDAKINDYRFINYIPAFHELVNSIILETAVENGH